MSNVCHMLLVVLHFKGHCFIYMNHCSFSLFYIYLFTAIGLLPGGSVDSRQWSACL